MRRCYGGMTSPDPVTQDVIQSAFVPKCVYCSTEMTRVLRDTLTESRYSLFKCEGCGWEVAVPLQDAG